MSTIINQLPLILTVLTALAGLIGWGIGRIRRGYGLERDIAHLKRDYQALSDNTATMLTELERRMDTIEREMTIIKTLNQSLMAQLSGGDSGFFHRLQDSQ